MFYPEIIRKYSSNSEKRIFFIAEVGTSHQGSIDMALEMIDHCVDQGVSAVKFQHVIAEEILHPHCGNIPLISGDIDLFQYFKKIEKKVDKAFWKKIIHYCQEKRLLFLCSFFGSQSFSDLKSLGVEAYKIASPEMNYYRLWKCLIHLDEPIFFSSGVSRMVDIDHLLNYLSKNGMSKEQLVGRLVHLHCITQYPASWKSYNIGFTQWFEKKYGILTGLSDHSDDPYLLPIIFTAHRAMERLPVVIEKHFTLKSLKHNIDNPVAIDEDELKELTQCLNSIYKYFSVLKAREGRGKEMDENLSSDSETILRGLSAIVKEKKDEHGEYWKIIAEIDKETLKKIWKQGTRELSSSEINDYPTTKRSLLAIRNIEEGETVSWDNSAYLRSEKNLMPGLDYHWEDKVIGTKVRRYIKNGEPILQDDLIVHPHTDPR